MKVFYSFFNFFLSGEISPNLSVLITPSLSILIKKILSPKKLAVYCPSLNLKEIKI